MTDRPTKSGRAVEPSRRGQKADFSSLNGRSVAVILRQGGQQFVHRGTAVFRRDDVLGNVLTITETDPQAGGPKLFISEEAWKGRIIPDLEHGCELCMIPRD